MNAKELGMQAAHPHNSGNTGFGLGLTKRELFAAMAMQALIAKAPIEYVDGQTEQTRSVAGGATDYADAILAELAKDQP